MLDGEPQVLRPYHAAEALTIEQAALIAGRSPRTIRDWAARLDLGRRIQGRWAISRIALQMMLDGNSDGLLAYLSGDRRSEAVITYYSQLGIPVPRRTIIGTKRPQGVEA